MTGLAGRTVVSKAGAKKTLPLAKSRADQVAQPATQEAIQMHGGIGVTDEYDVGLYLKRVHVVQQMFGEDGFHSDRWAKKSGIQSTAERPKRF